MYGHTHIKHHVRTTTTTTTHAQIHTHHHHHYHHHLRRHFGSSRIDIHPDFGPAWPVCCGVWYKARLFIQRSPGVLSVLFRNAVAVLFRVSRADVHCAVAGSCSRHWQICVFLSCMSLVPESLVDTRWFASRALPCASCPCAPDTSFPCLGNGDLASVLLVPFVAPGAAPSLRTWWLRTMYFVKFDWVVLFKLKGWTAATLPRAAPLAATWLGLPARSRTCPPRFQTPMPLALFAACWAAPLQPARFLSVDLQLGSAGDLACWSTFPWKLSGEGKCTSERKAGSLDLPLELWTIWVPYQVTFST